MKNLILPLQIFPKNWYLNLLNMEIYNVCGSTLDCQIFEIFKNILTKFCKIISGKYNI
jgi:hypothetical protein